MYDELVKRLRKREVNLKEKFSRKAELLSELRQAADAIEELNLIAESNRRNAKAWADTAEAAVEQIPRWVSVTEQLPEEKRATYLCLIDGDYCCEVRWTNNIYGFRESDKWGWSIFDIPQYSKVTHWMPLPELPKEEV